MLRDGQKHELDKQHLPSSFSNKSRMERFSDGCWLMQHLYFDLLLSPVLFLLNRNMCAQTMKPSLHKFPSSCFKSVNWTLFAVCLFCLFRFFLHGIACVVCVQIERRLELVRLVSHNAHKKMVSCLQGQLGTDTEKRHVRSLHFSLSLISFTSWTLWKHTTLNMPS